MSAFRTALSISLGLLAASLASGASAASGELDQKRVHADYNEGNFEKVISALEGYMAAHETYGFQDSVFIAKHLAVVYSANPDTREKGKYYMYRLLSLLPSAKLVDMYVSDEIDRLFDKVREEFMSRQRAFGVDTAKVSVPARSPGSPARDPGTASGRAAQGAGRSAEGSHRTLYLAAGGAIVLATGLAAYFAFSDSPRDTEKTYVVP
jgi:hypothetical protein